MNRKILQSDLYVASPSQECQEDHHGHNGSAKV